MIPKYTVESSLFSRTSTSKYLNREHGGIGTVDFER